MDCYGNPSMSYYNSIKDGGLKYSFYMIFLYYSKTLSCPTGHYLNDNFFLWETPIVKKSTLMIPPDPKNCVFTTLEHIYWW